MTGSFAGCPFSGHEILLCYEDQYRQSGISEDIFTKDLYGKVLGILHLLRKEMILS